MLPYAPDPATTMTLASLYSQELRAEAASYRLARSAKLPGRAQRLRPSAASASANRHLFSWSRGRAGGDSRALAPH